MDDSDNDRRSVSRRKIDQDNLKIKTALFSGEVSGRSVLIALILIIIAAPVCAGLYIHNIETADRLGRLEALLQNQLEAIDALIYLASLNDSAKQLQLHKPKRIRELEQDRGR